MSVKVKYSDELYHHGILGQKWGIRRFQNPDGSYTPEGLKRYGRNRRITNDQIRRADKIVDYGWDDQDMPDKAFSVLGADKTILNNARNTYRNLCLEGKQVENDIEKYLVSKNGTKLTDWDAIYENFRSDVPKNDRARMYCAANIASRFTNYRSPKYKSLQSLRDDADMEDIRIGLIEEFEGDGQEGDITAWSTWLTNKLPEKTLNAMIEYDKHEREAHNTVFKDILSEISLGKNPESGKVWGIANRISNNLLYKTKENIGLKGVLASDYEDFYKPNIFCYSKYNPAISFSNEIMSKLNDVKQNNLWAVGPAIEDLGFSDKKYSEMTNQDWYRIVKKANEYQERDIDF